ncbi:ABC transporter ATP-binding protein [Roseisalinus antarcticus]|uniref:Putative D,D-dipeptide transport ATP-binding protein DdpF n=1 Tax=Roseisalinus antarcticus TaxID=254357 RepID=A0A1Y5TY05_9RHOB|nr:oligopeptide/dipeptide ABC transporter ATP-binding protein [Roseisalinus antarcticus]SLN73554.1 putative D,D-dipeptide transport ATP-binding protein DdpF [Roseisalinus antarcticus]
MTEPLISALGIDQSFPVGAGFLGGPRRRLHALRGVDVTVAPGETLGLVGESGCGKSTLARVLLGLEPPTAGSVIFDGTDLARLPAVSLRRLRRRFQVVFQDPAASLNPRMTAAECIAEPLINLTDLSTAEIDARVLALAASVGLGSHLLDRFPHELSGGQCQRVGLARAIAPEPDLIVADEPVSALDVSIQAQILNLMLEIKARMGLAMVFISHDLSVVAHVADRVAVMYLGRIVESGPAEEVFARPRHPYTRMLIGSVPHPRPPPEGGRPLPKGELPSPLNPPPGCAFHSRCPLADNRCLREVPQLLPEVARHRTACHRVAEDATEGA